MNFADKISTLRIILIPVFVSLLIYSQYHYYLRFVAAGVFILAVLSDFFDGLVARIKKEKSEIGQIIDPLADKLLLLTAFISFYLLREALPFFRFKIPLGLVLVVVSRDIIIVLGLAISNLLKIEIPIVPTFWGKFTTFFQMFTIVSILFDIVFFPYVWKVAMIFTLISGVDYFLRGVREVNAKINNYPR